MQPETRRTLAVIFIIIAVLAFIGTICTRKYKFVLQYLRLRLEIRTHSRFQMTVKWSLV